MTRFISTKRGNPCVICGNTSGKCREAESVRLCMTIADAVSGAAVPGYKFIGQTKDGLWGKFVEDDGQDWTFQQRQEWQQEQERLRRQRAAEEAKRRAEALPALERDRLYRNLLSQLTLHPADRADLKRRGLSDEQIEQGGFKSVEQWQQLESELPHQLPGTNLDGLSLNTQPGYLCPIKDADGLIVGCQIRLRDANDGGRYRWLTSATKKRPTGPTPHLPNGELPLAVHRPHEVKLSGIGMTEGTGVKPFLAAQRLGQTVIGAAGGQFAASPQTLKATLEQLGSKTIDFYPDAGSVSNRNVIRQYKALWTLLRQWGYRVRVVWWGQATKDALDIDELQKLDALSYITPDEFLEIVSTHTPNPDKRDRTLSADEWTWKHGLPQWFREKLAQLPQIFKGFGKPPAPKTVATPKPSSPPKVISYTPGDRIPSQEQYKAMGCPTIRFAREDRLQLYAELVAAGWQHILDRSGTGSGKSHDVGLAQPQQFDVTKLLYFAENHRNPTVATIEANYTDMPVRHDGFKKGLVEDPTRQTALGNSHTRWALSGEKPTIQGNCPHTQKFHILTSKGYHGAEATSKVNPVCGDCQHRWTCGNKLEASPGSDYRAQRAEAWEQPLLRLSWESASDAGTLQESGAFWDEAMRQIKPTEAIEARLPDFERLFADLETEAPEIYDLLTPMRRQLRSILAGRVKVTQETRHGWNDAILRGILGAPPENLEEIVAKLYSLQPKLEEILTTDKVLVGDNRDVEPDAVKRLNKMVGWESRRDSKQQLESLPSNWLIPFLEVWGGLQRGAIRIGGGVLTVTTRNSRPAEIATAAAFNVYLDATASHEYLSLYLGIDPGEIVQIEQEPARFDNLKIVQITGLGLAGRDRSDSATQRITAAKAELRSLHPDIAFIDHKDQAEPGDGYWFVHNRGSNEFQTRSALASIGVPYQNIGHIQDVYITLTDDRNVDRGAARFDDFVQWLTQSEIAQTPNRLRANRRPDAQVIYYAVTDYDLEFLKEYYPDSAIEQIDAFDLTPAAGSATQQSHWKIQQAILTAVQETGKAIENLTQEEVAKFAKVTQGRIAQVASKYGGWKAFLKLLASLYRSINRGTNNPPKNNLPLDEEQEFIARTYLPLVAVEDPPDAVEALLFTVKSYGWQVFEAILATLDFITKGRLLGAMMSGLPDVLRKEFRAAVIAAGG